MFSIANNLPTTMCACSSSLSLVLNNVYCIENSITKPKNSLHQCTNEFNYYYTYIWYLTFSRSKVWNNVNTIPLYGQNNLVSKQSISWAPPPDILRQRTRDTEVKRYCISLLEKFGSFQYSRDTLQRLDAEARAEVSIGSCRNIPKLRSYSDIYNIWRKQISS